MAWFPRANALKLMRARTDDRGDGGDFRAASLRQIHQEIVEGNLRNERARLDDALYNLEFYRGDF